MSCLCSIKINGYQSKFSVACFILHQRVVFSWKTPTQATFSYYVIMSNIWLFRIFNNFLQSFCYAFFFFYFMNSALFIWCCKKITPLLICNFVIIHKSVIIEPFYMEIICTSYVHPSNCYTRTTITPILHVQSR